MPLRLAPVLVACASVVVIAGCVATTAPPATPSFAPVPTPVVWPSFEPTGPDRTATPDAGNVQERPAGPMLSIEPVDPGTIRATIEDADAKAWRLVVAGTGSAVDDRLEIVVETGDVGPLITATEVRGGKVVDVMDLSEFGNPTAAAGGCHGTLRVCIDSDGFRLPSDGDGLFAVTLSLMDAAAPLTITGGTASWPGEPFILGPWTDTEAFPWDPGAAG